MADDITAVIGSVEEFASMVIKKLTLDITANLVQDTPVDTGWARANWVPSIGDYNSSPVGVRQPGSIETDTQNNGIATVAAKYNIKQGNVYITNNVPYINTLNDGYSKQAPAGFIQAAIGQAVSKNFGGG